MKNIFLLILLVSLFFGCSSEKKQTYAEEIETYQYELNVFYSDKKTSPLKEEDLKTFKQLNFFPTDESYKIVAKFEKTPDEIPFEMQTSTDRLPVYLQYGIATFSIDGKELSLRVYQEQESVLEPDYDAHLALENKINDTKGKTGLHHILNIVNDNNRLIDEVQIYQSTKSLHYTLWNELALEKRWNTKFYGKKGTADHIVLPSTLFDKKGLEYVNNSFKVFRRGYLFTKRGYINRWQYKKGKHRGKGYSDHLPVYAYFDAKPYVVQAVKHDVLKKEEVKNIDYFYTQKILKNDIVIENAIVVWKRRGNALIKQTKEGRGIFLFGSASALEVGKKYDLLVRAMKDYKGLKELTHVYIRKYKGSAKFENYILGENDLSQEIAYRQNEVLSNIEGMYKNKHFYVQGRKIPIYFKKKKFTPPNGSKLKIHNALLGYYKKLQLVIYSQKDFTVMGK